MNLLKYKLLYGHRTRRTIRRRRKNSTLKLFKNDAES